MWLGIEMWILVYGIEGVGNSGRLRCNHMDDARRSAERGMDM